MAAQTIVQKPPFYWLTLIVMFAALVSVVLA